jgi:hypothetical protein
MPRFAKFACEDCETVFRVPVVDVFEDGTLKPEGKYVMRADKWFDENNREVPPFRSMFVDPHGRLIEDASCPKCEAEAQRQFTAPAIATDKGKATDSIAKDLMTQFDMGNMKDAQRPGDAAGIPIANHLKPVADNMFRKKQIGNVSGARGMLQPALGPTGNYANESGSRAHDMLKNLTGPGKFTGKAVQ